MQVRAYAHEGLDFAHMIFFKGVETVMLRPCRVFKDNFVLSTGSIM